eukprot:GHVO01053472.1.p1 GENE.GHVO01053472.1~~GHVO01053472.1.p1  ORF type:complete len:152 (+),score=4.63 GHVO01053472.1:31-486(+)
MGGDGGSIPGRADVVKTKGMRFVRNLGGMGYTPNTQVRSAEEAYSKVQERSLRWKNCALTTEPLRKPIVVCQLGRLYNKDRLIEAVLAKSKAEVISHIKSLKDVKEIKTTLSDNGCMTCNFSKGELDGGAHGWVIWPCGCLFGKALPPSFF